MKLAIEVTTCGPTRAGVGYYTEHLVDAVLATRSAGDEVVLLSNHLPAPELATRWDAHLVVAGTATRGIWMQSDVPSLLTGAHADVALFPNYVVPFASPCPSVVVVHDLALLRMPFFFTRRKRALMEPLLRRSIASASLVGTVSEASSRDIVDLLGINKERIVMMPGAAHPSCKRASLEAVETVRARYKLRRPYVLTVGTLEPRKNLATVLRAFDELAATAPDHELIVVGGRGWMDQAVLRAMEARAPSGRVRWLGYVPEEELAALYSGADVFVYASHLEGFGLPVLEAMACGVPVVASDVAALREVGGDVARYVSPSDASAFASAIAQTIGDTKSARAARYLGLARAKQFSWERSAQTLWERARAMAPLRIVSRPMRIESSAQVFESPLGATPTQLRAREWSILATVTYADLFDMALPEHKAETAMLGDKFGPGEARDICYGPQLSSLLTFRPEGYIALAHRGHLVDRVPAQRAKTAALLASNDRVLSVLGALPFVRSLALSGELVHHNPGTRTDIDLFVIAARGRIYTAYTMLFLATKLSGTRDIICPNYLVDESELAIAYHRDLFTAHQVVSARALSGHATFEAWCGANQDWVRQFYPAFGERSPVEERQQKRSGLPIQRALEFLLAPVAPAIERTLRWGWRARLRARAAGQLQGDVVLGEGILKLHLSDYRKRVLKRFSDRLHALRTQLTPTAPSPAGPELT